MTLQDLYKHIDAEAQKKKDAARSDYLVAGIHCKKGIYDKFYRYHRSDNGFAYDLGWMHANETYKNEKVQFIECDVVIR